MRYTTHNEKETKELASRIARDLESAQVFALNGDLGAGKTTFSQGFGEGLGVTKVINSPTFVVMKIYPIQNLPCKKCPWGAKFKIQNLVHIDAYRLKSATDLENIGAMEYFHRDDTVVLIEWAERIKKSLPTERIEIDFEADGDKRNIEIKKRPS